ncbi:MAG TPA: GNAT family N-acetyltransferase [Actinomycetota bacterium]
MTREIRIRRVRREEWEPVRELRLRALADAPDAFASTLERERRLGQAGWIDWIEGWEGATNVMFVAERDEGWIGMALGSRTGDEPEAHLYGMWVEPAWRARGVGADLVERVLSWARSWSARSVILAVTETNTGAATFYEHLGFEDTGEREPLREGTELRVRMMRRES